MSDPRRLLSGSSDATALERRLLGAGRLRREPEGMRDRVLVGVGAAVAAGAIASTAATAKAATAGTAKATVAGSALAKAKLVIVSAALVTAAAGTTTYVAMSDPPKAPVTAPVVVATTATAPVATSASPAAPAAPANDLPIAAPATTASAAPRGRAFVPPRRSEAPPAPAPAPAPADTSVGGTANAPSLARSELREEAALVDEARSALASGDLVTASERLARADARFPRGRLAEEREALAVRVAAAAGDAPRASRLARTFLGRHPTSPLRPWMESIAKKDAIE